MNNRNNCRHDRRTSRHPELKNLQSYSKELRDAIVIDAANNIASCGLGTVTEELSSEVLRFTQTPLLWSYETAPTFARQLSSALATNSNKELSYEFWLALPSFTRLLREALHGFTQADSIHLEVPDGYVRLTIGDFAYILLQVREVLGLYARLTRASTVGSDNEALQKAFSRLTATPPCILPPCFSLVGEVMLESFDLSYLQRLYEDCAWLPKHGPGSCAEFQEWNNGPRNPGKAWKHAWKESFRWTNDPLRQWVREDWFRTIFASTDGDAQTVDFGTYNPDAAVCSASRLWAVPKDYRGPRIIAMEPCVHQYIQQSAFARFMGFLPFSPLGRAVRLDRSDLNAKDALTGSVNGELATIDLTDASDYVRVWHVSAMCARLPRLRDYLFALRTDKVQLGDQVAPITTFAPMGSALCPPIQSAFYATLIVSAYWQQEGRGQIITAGSVLRALRKLKLRCYNDDIIISSQFAELAITALEEAGLLPNRSKCCIHGKFRESCGIDAYGGYDVTPLRPRQLPGSVDISLMGLLDSISNFWAKGFKGAALRLLLIVQKNFRIEGRLGWEYLVPILNCEERVPGCVSLPGIDLYGHGVIQHHPGMFTDHNIQRICVRSYVEREITCKRDPLNRGLRDALSRKGVSERPFSGYATGRKRYVTTTLILPEAAYACRINELEKLVTSDYHTIVDSPPTGIGL